MKKIIFISVFIFLSIHGFSQNNFFMGFDAARSYDKYDMYDTGNKAYVPELKSSNWSFLLGYTMLSTITFETGVMLKFYKEGAGIVANLGPTYGISSGFSSWQVPVRIGARIPLYQDKIFMYTRAGYHLCKNNAPNNIGTSFSSAYNPTTKEYEYLYTTDYRTSSDRYFNLLETAIGLEFKLSERLQLVPMVSYYTGFKPLIMQDLKYSIAGETVQQAQIVSKGNYLNYSLCMRFNFNKIKE